MGPRDNPQQGNYYNNPEQNQAGNRLYNDSYGANNNRSNGLDQVSRNDAMVQQELNSVISHLQNAESLVEQRGPNAAQSEYSAAIRAADSINQQAVAQERQAVAQQLQNGNLDQQTRRALLQEDADLHTLQRAPGFARANFALLNIKNGNQAFGTQLLLEAEQRDPEMSSDPNFQRHLKLALDMGTASIRNAAGQGTPTDTGNPTYNPAQPGQPGSDQTQVPGRTTDQTQPTTGAGTTSPVLQAEALYNQVRQNPAAMTQDTANQFQQIIQQADAGPSPILQTLVQQENALAQQLQPIAQPAFQQQIAQYDTAANTEINKVTAGNPQAQQQMMALYNQMDQATSLQQRQAIEAALIKMDPAMQQLLTQRDGAIGQQNIQNMCQYFGLKQQIAAEQNQSAITRFTFGMALALAGDNKDAQTEVKDALSKNLDPALSAYWQQVYAALGQGQNPAQNPGQIATPGQPGQIATPGQPGAQDSTTTGSAAQILNSAETAFNTAAQQKQNLPNALNQLGPTFMAAIHKADAEYQQAGQLAAQDQQLQAQLSKMYTPQQQTQITNIGKQIDAALPSLTPQDQQRYLQYENPALTDAQRQQIRSQISNPQFGALLDQFSQATGPQGQKLMMQIASDQSQIQSAVEGRFLTRYYLADAAQRAGDKQTAVTELTNAFESVPPTYQKAFAGKQEVQTLAKNIGVDLTKLPIQGTPTDQVAGTPAQPGNGQIATPGQPGSDRTQTPGQPGQPGTDQSGPQQNPQDLMTTAQRDLQAKGMTPDVKAEFNAALKAADAMWTPQDQQTTQLLLQALQSGKKADGTALTAQDRVQAHELINQEFAIATLGMQYRMVYGNLLNQNKQFASAEQVFKDNIAIADKLPLQQFQQELNQLGKDVQDPNLNTAQKNELFKFMQSIQGSGTSKDDGLMYLPITARKQAAIFYISGDLPGANGAAPVGIVKPEQAMNMIDDAQKKEQQLYGVDLSKNKSWDPTLANLAQSIMPMLPENLRKEKEKTDSLWSNTLVDAGAAAGAIALAGFAASVLTKNPTFAKWAVTMDETGTTATGLSLAGKVALGTGTIGVATVGRHYGHELLTGNSEGWDTSLIHGAAGVGAAWTLMATRNAASNFLFKNSAGTAEEIAAGTRGATMQGDAVLRVAQAQGALSGDVTAQSLVGMYGDASKVPQALADLAKATPDQVIVSGGKVVNAIPGLTSAESANAIGLIESNASRSLTAGDLATWMAGKGRNWVIPDALKGMDASTQLVKDGALTAEGQGLDLGFSNAQAVNMAHAAAQGETGGIVARQMGKLGGLFKADTYRALNPVGGLDLTSATTQQMGMRTFYSGYTAGVAGLGAYNTMTALDGSTSPNTSFAQRFMANNFASVNDNVLVNPLFFLAPGMADGKIAKNFVSAEAGPISNGFGYFKRAFSTSAESAVARDQFTGFGLQAAQMAKGMAVYNFNNYSKSLSNFMASRALSGQLDAYNKPVVDEAPPTAQGMVTVHTTDAAQQQQQQPQKKPADQSTTAGVTDQTPPPGNSQLTQGTPGGLPQ